MDSVPQWVNAWTDQMKILNAMQVWWMQCIALDKSICQMNENTSFLHKL